MARHGDQGAYEVGNVEIIKQEENAREGVVGECNGRAKVTAEKVLAIRARKGKATSLQIATEFGISSAQVRRILRRENWHHLRPPRVRLVKQVEQQPRVWETPVVKLYRVFLKEAA